MKLDLVAALALGALAIAMRVPALETAGELKSDETFEYLHARAIARDGDRPAVGLRTTEGPRVPPHRLYLFALPLTVADGPLAVMRFVALLNAAAIPAAFLVGRRDLGRRTALVWALLLAVAPGLVRFGRAIWGPDLLLPISVAVVLALARMRRSPRAVAVALPLASLIANVHYAAVGLAALVVGRAIALWGRARRPVALGAALALAVAAPFVTHEVASGFAETRAALDVVRGGGRTAAIPGEKPPRGPWIVPMTFELVSPHRATEPLAKAHAAEVVERVPGGEATIALASLALLVVCAAGIALGARDLARRQATAASLGALALLGAWAPFFLGLPARPHYAIPAAAPLLLVAASACARPRAGGAAAALLLAIAVPSAGTTLAVRHTLERHLGSSGGGFDVAVGAKLDACRFVVRHELRLTGYPRIEYVLLLDEALRELARDDPPAAERFRMVPFPAPELRYWIEDSRFPVPLLPRGDVDLRIVEDGAPALPGEAARFGAIAVVVSAAR
jgi:hypothetical protein